MQMLRVAYAVLIAGLLWSASSAGWAAVTLQQVPPESVGFSPERLARLGDVLEADIKAGRIPGAVVLVMRHGKIAYFEAFGSQDPQHEAVMRKDSIFRIYSMTKPIISTAVMMLWEDGRFDLDDPIAKYLPALKDLKVAVVHKSPDGKSSIELQPARHQPTIQQLLDHTGGLSYDILPKSQDYPVRQMYMPRPISETRTRILSDLVAKLGKLPLASEPGSTWEYSRSVDVLAQLVEVVSGMPIDRFLKERILTPLGMKDTGFWVPADNQNRVAEPFKGDPAPGYPVRFLDVTKPPKLLSGNYGLVSTAEDYARFTQMLLSDGSLGDTRLLAPKTVQYMTSDQIGPIRGPLYLPGAGYGFGLGFAVRLIEGRAPYPGSVGDFAWGGAAGTTFWVDPREDLTAVFMTQRFGDASAHYTRLIRTLVYQAIIQ